MNPLEKFGVSAADVAEATKTGPKYPKPVEGRVAHIDGDFIAYQTSAESKAELDPEDPTPRKTVEDMKHNAWQAVEHIRKMAGANTAVVHMTHKSNKGGRDSQAILKEYQGNRKNRDNSPEHLDVIREYLVNMKTDRITGRNHPNQEADDGMCQAHYADPKNAIICSMDKDLCMVPGWKLDMYTNKIRKVPEGFGEIRLDDSKSTKKIVGYGTSFFWAQLLTGDTADNISGLPEVPGATWQEVDGTAEYKKTMAKWIDETDPAKATKLSDKLDKLQSKTKKCGPVMAMKLMQGMKRDKECFLYIRALYLALEKDHGYEFKHWKTGERVSALSAMVSDMQLLWMRRTESASDVVDWIKEFMSARY